MVPQFDLSFLTRSPDTSALEQKQRGLWDEVYRPSAPQMGPAIGKQDLPFLLLGMLGAKALGANNRDVSEGFQGFMGARQDMRQTQYQNAMNQDMWRRKKAEFEAGQIGDQIDRQRKDFEYKRGLMDENRKDLRNFDQQKQLSQMGIDARAAEAERNREARKNSAEGQALSKQEAFEQKLIQDIPSEQDRLEGFTLLAKRRSAFMGETVFTAEDDARLKQILAKQTLTGQGKALKNEHQATLNKWADKTEEARYNGLVLSNGLKGLDAQLKKKNLLYYDDNQKFKRLMIELAINRENRQIQNDGLNYYLRSQGQDFDQKAKAIDGLDKQIAAQEKSIEEAMTNMAPLEAFKFNQNAKATIAQLKAQRDAILNTVPDFAPPTNPYAPAQIGGDAPFAIGPIGNTGKGTRPQAVAPRVQVKPTQAKPAQGKNDIQRAKSRFGQGK